MELIKKDTKPCPTCGTMIFKISGCSQVWCVDCHTAFDFNTLVIERGNIHNPHYYEYMRKMNGGVVPRNPGDVPAQNQRVGIGALMMILGSQRGTTGKMMNYITNFHRFITHVQAVEINTRNNPVLESTNRQFRIRYLMKEITESEFKRKILKSKENFEQQLELNAIYEAFVETGNDILKSIIEQNNFNYSINVINDLENLVGSLNEQLKKFCKKYKMRLCPGVDEDLLFRRDLK